MATDRRSPDHTARLPGGDRGQTDARLAHVFRQIRAIAQVSEMDMARRLGTGVDVVLNFEAGAIDALPPWPETARIVERYATVGGVDPAPILSRLLNLQSLPVAPPPASNLALLRDAAVIPRSLPLAHMIEPPHTIPPIEARVAPAPRAWVPPHQLDPSAPAPLAPPSPTEVPVGFGARSKLRTGPGDAPPRTRTPAAADRDEATAIATRSRQRRRLIKTLIATSPFILIAMIVLLVQTVPGPVYALSRVLPGVLGTATRGLVDTVALQTATFKDGLRWIDPADPRQRKAHRLAGP